MSKPMMKLTDKEKKMGDALMMTRKGKEIMNAQKRMEDEKEKAGAAKRARADKLLGIGMKKGGEMKKADKAGRALVKKSADTMGRAMVKKAGGGKCYAKGGSVSARADGVATKGKTHTEMVKMARGGMMAKMTPRTEYGGVEKAKGGKVKKMAMGGVGTGRASMASEPGMQTPRGARVVTPPPAAMTRLPKGPRKIYKKGGKC